MKRILILLSLVFLVFSAKSQTNYLLADSVKWELEGSECCPVWTWDAGTVISKGDTIINNNYYEIIGWENTRNDYALREDTTGKIWVIYLDHLLGYGTEDSIYSNYLNDWYYKLSNDSSEYLLYDFNAEIGDTLSIYFPSFSNGRNVADTGGYYNFRVYGIETSCVDGDDKKRVKMWCADSVPNATQIYDIEITPWIETIGAVRCGPIYTMNPTSFEFIPAEVINISHAGETIYPCTSKITEATEKYNLLYPNPTQGVVEIKSKTQIKTIRVIDDRGEQIKEINNVDKKKVEINFNTHKGIYIIQLLDINNNQTSHKIIVL